LQFTTMILLALSANTSFGGLPVLLKLLARDNYAPHVFALKADRQVHRHGVLALAVVSAALLVFSGGDTNTLVPLFAIGVFVGFTIAQVGMVRHWLRSDDRGRRGKALLNGSGAVLTGVAAVVVTAEKFTEGAWIVVVALPLLIAAFETVHRAYARIGERLGLGRVPEPPHRARSLVIVPVSSLSRLTSQALSAAESLGDEVRAVTVCHPDPEDRAALHALERAWADWDPGVPLVRLNCAHRSLGRPIAAYVREIGAPDTQVTVLIPETEPERLWQRLLQNQRGAVVAHTVRRETDAVICRLRFRIDRQL
ncbi:MAG TPA: amino acid permease, partial [Streptomyces sp.]